MTSRVKITITTEADEVLEQFAVIVEWEGPDEIQTAKNVRETIENNFETEED